MMWLTFKIVKGSNMKKTNDELNLPVVGNLIINFLALIFINTFFQMKSFTSQKNIYM